MTEERAPSTGGVAVITDTTTAIPDELVDSLKIQMVPYYVNVGNKTLRDVVDLSRDEFYKWLPDVDKLPTTSNPSAGDYVEAFRNAYQRTREMVAITMTSLGSGAYQTATIAKEMILEELPDIKVLIVDSRQVAMAHGWAVIEAAREALAGASLLTVGRVARETAYDAQMLQTADTLKYLYMGGRIGRALHLVGSVLRIKPIISMVDGEIVPAGQARSRLRAYDKMVDLIGRKVGKGARIRVAYMHAAALDEVSKIRSRVEAEFECVESLVIELSPALGVHTGPGTAGLAYVKVGQK